MRIALGLAICLSVIGVTAREQPARRSFDCRTTFTRDLSAADLVRTFGAAAVTTGDIYLGEGEHEDGTILFDAVPEDRVEVLWRDRATQRNPRMVRVRGTSSRWRTPLGLRLGDSLRRVEALNRRPFRLLGYGSEGNGSVMSWSAGELDTADAADCRTRVRLVPQPFPEDQATQRVMAPIWTGNQEFSSGHPAFQALQPTVKEILLVFDRFVEEFTIRRAGVGPIAVGMSVTDVSRMFPPDRRHAIQIAGEDGSYAALALTAPGNGLRDGIVVELQQRPNGARYVERIKITDPHVQTLKGIGVGSTVDRLRSTYDVDWVGFGEGPFCMHVAEIGATFCFYENGGPPVLAGVRDPAKVPGDRKIDLIFLVGSR